MNRPAASGSVAGDSRGARGFGRGGASLIRKVFWPVVGLVAVAVSLWLLWHELRGVSVAEVRDSLAAIPASRWLLAALAALCSYAALAAYDRIALRHIGRKVPALFVALCSFTTYALSHNIGGSVLSGAVIRYRAYGTQGLSAQEVGVLVALCSLTFALSSVLVTSAALALNPRLLERFSELPDSGVEVWLAAAGFLLIAAYAAASILHLKPLRLGGFTLAYPAPGIVVRQLTIGPLEVLAAAAIVYFALPVAGNPGYLTVLGIFMVSFSAALMSHAPGGIGVFEWLFVMALPDIDPAQVLAALLVFRLLYLIIPLALAIPVVLWFERSQYMKE